LAENYLVETLVELSEQFLPDSMYIRQLTVHMGCSYTMYDRPTDTLDTFKGTFPFMKEKKI
jgi:hypothetical protein